MTETLISLNINLPKNKGSHKLEVSSNTPVSAILKTVKKLNRLDDNDLELFLSPKYADQPGRWLNKLATFSSENVPNDSILQVRSRDIPYEVKFSDGSSMKISLNSSCPIFENIRTICDKSGLTFSNEYELYSENGVPFVSNNSLESQGVSEKDTLIFANSSSSYSPLLAKSKYLTPQDLHLNFEDHQNAFLRSILITNDQLALNLASISLFLQFGSHDQNKFGATLDQKIPKILPKRAYHKIIQKSAKTGKAAFKKFKSDLMAQYSLLRGTNDEMKIKYIETCQKSDYYGIYFFPCYMVCNNVNESFLCAIYDGILHLINYFTLEPHHLIDIFSIKKISLIDSVLEISSLNTTISIESDYSIQLWIGIYKNFSGSPESANFILKGKTPIPILLNYDLIGCSTELGILKSRLMALDHDFSADRKCFLDNLKDIGLETISILNKKCAEEFKASLEPNQHLRDILYANYYDLHRRLDEMKIYINNDEKIQGAQKMLVIMEIFLKIAAILVQGSLNGDNFLNSNLAQLADGIRNYVQLCESTGIKNSNSSKLLGTIIKKIQNQIKSILNALYSYYMPYPGEPLHSIIVFQLDSAINQWCNEISLLWSPYIDENSTLIRSEKIESINAYNIAVNDIWNTIKSQIIVKHHWIINSNSSKQKKVKIQHLKATLDNQLKILQLTNDKIEDGNSENELNLVWAASRKIQNLCDQLILVDSIYTQTENSVDVPLYENYADSFEMFEALLKESENDKFNQSLIRSISACDNFLDNLKKKMSYRSNSNLAADQNSHNENLNALMKTKNSFEIKRRHHSDQEANRSTKNVNMVQEGNPDLKKDGMENDVATAQSTVDRIISSSGSSSQHEAKTKGDESPLERFSDPESWPLEIRECYNAVDKILNDLRSYLNDEKEIEIFDIKFIIRTLLKEQELLLVYYSLNSPYNEKCLIDPIMNLVYHTTDYLAKVNSLFSNLPLKNTLSLTVKESLVLKEIGNILRNVITSNPIEHLTKLRRMIPNILKYSQKNIISCQSEWNELQSMCVLMDRVWMFNDPILRVLQRKYAYSLSKSIRESLNNPMEHDLKVGSRNQTNDLSRDLDDECNKKSLEESKLEELNNQSSDIQRSCLQLCQFISSSHYFFQIESLLKNILKNISSLISKSNESGFSSECTNYCTTISEMLRQIVDTSLNYIWSQKIDQGWDIFDKVVQLMIYIDNFSTDTNSKEAFRLLVYSKRFLRTPPEIFNTEKESTTNPVDNQKILEHLISFFTHLISFSHLHPNISNKERSNMQLKLVKKTLCLGKILKFSNLDPWINNNFFSENSVELFNNSIESLFMAVSSIIGRYNSKDYQRTIHKAIHLFESLPINFSGSDVKDYIIEAKDILLDAKLIKKISFHKSNANEMSDNNSLRSVEDENKEHNSGDGNSELYDICAEDNYEDDICDHNQNKEYLFQSNLDDVAQKMDRKNDGLGDDLPLVSEPTNADNEFEDDFHDLKFDIQNLIIKLTYWDRSPGRATIFLLELIHMSDCLCNYVVERLLPMHLDDDFVKIIHEFYSIWNNLIFKPIPEISQGFDSLISLIKRIEADYIMDQYAEKCEEIITIMKDCQEIVNKPEFHNLNNTHNQVFFKKIHLVAKIFQELRCNMFSDKSPATVVHCTFQFLGYIDQFIEKCFVEITSISEDPLIKTKIESWLTLELGGQLLNQRKIQGQLWIPFFEKSVSLGFKSLQNVIESYNKDQLSQERFSSSMQYSVLASLINLENLFKLNTPEKYLNIAELANLHPEIALGDFQSKILMYLTTLNSEGRISKSDPICSKLYLFYNSLSTFINHLSTGIVAGSYKKFIDSCKALHENLDAEVVPESVILIENFLETLIQLENNLDAIYDENLGCDLKSSTNLPSTWIKIRELGSSIFKNSNSILQEYSFPQMLETHINELLSNLQKLCEMISLGHNYQNVLFQKDIIFQTRSMLNKIHLFMESIASVIKEDSSIDRVYFPFSRASRSISIVLNTIHQALKSTKKSISMSLNKIINEIDSVIFSYQSASYPSSATSWDDSLGDSLLKSIKYIETFLLTNISNPTIENIKYGSELLMSCFENLCKVLPFAQFMPLSINLSILSAFKDIVMNFRKETLDSWSEEKFKRSSVIDTADPTKTKSKKLQKNKERDLEDSGHRENEAKRSKIKGKKDFDEDVKNKCKILKRSETINSHIKKSSKEIKLDKDTSQSNITGLKYNDFKKESKYSKNSKRNTTQVQREIESKYEICEKLKVLHQYIAQYIDQLSWVWRLVKNASIELVDQENQSIMQLNAERIDSEIDLKAIEENMFMACSTFELVWDDLYHFGAFEICKQMMRFGSVDKGMNSVCEEKNIKLSKSMKLKTLSTSKSNDSISPENNISVSENGCDNVSNEAHESYAQIDMKSKLKSSGKINALKSSAKVINEKDSFEKRVYLDRNLILDSSAELLKARNKNSFKNPIPYLISIETSTLQQSIKPIENLVSNIAIFLQAVPIAFSRIRTEHADSHNRELDDERVTKISKKLKFYIKKVTGASLALLSSIKTNREEFKSSILKFKYSIVELSRSLQLLSFPSLFELEGTQIMSQSEISENSMKWHVEMFLEARKVLAESSKNATHKLMELEIKHTLNEDLDPIIKSINDLASETNRLLHATYEVQRSSSKEMINFPTLDNNSDVINIQDEENRNNDINNVNDMQKQFNINENGDKNLRAVGKQDTDIPSNNNNNDNNNNNNNDMNKPLDKYKKSIKKLVSSCCSVVICVSYLINNSCLGKECTIEKLSASLMTLSASLNNLSNVSRSIRGITNDIDPAIKKVTEFGEALVEAARSIVSDETFKTEDIQILDPEKIAARTAELEQILLVQKLEKELEINKEELRRVSNCRC